MIRLEPEHRPWHVPEQQQGSQLKKSLLNTLGEGRLAGFNSTRAARDREREWIQCLYYNRHPTLPGKFWFYVLPSGFESLEQNQLHVWNLFSITMKHKLQQKKKKKKKDKFL